MHYDLGPKAHVPVREERDTSATVQVYASCSEFLRYKMSISNGNSYPTTLTSDDDYEPIYRRSVLQFPLLELPAELRIMIAKYAFHRSKGLIWEWECHRKGKRAATFQHNNIYVPDKLQGINALARTCKTPHAETRGLALQVNTLHFDRQNMHSSRTPE